MKARTESGEIITLPKECNCCTHNEPHWVWLDEFARKQNAESLADAMRLNDVGGWSAATVPALMKYAADAEVRRLNEKMQNMSRLGIVELIREPSDDLSELQQEGIRARTMALVKQWEKEREQRHAPIQTNHDRRREFLDKKHETEVAARNRL